MNSTADAMPRVTIGGPLFHRFHRVPAANAMAMRVIAARGMGGVTGAGVGFSASLTEAPSELVTRIVE